MTFTNKATEEMKSRIIETLTSLSKGISPLTFELKNDLKLSDQELMSRSEAVLKNILHNYSSFGVMTIDAFFQKVVRSFAREIGVQGGFQVELDQKKAISEVVDKVLDEIGENETLTSWLVEFAFYKINNGQSWDTKRDINSLSQELFGEMLIQERDNLFVELDDPDFLTSFIDSLSKLVGLFDKSLVSQGNSALKIMSKYGLEPSDFSYGLAGVGGFLLKLSQGTVVEPGSRVHAAINEGKWCSKSSDKKDSIESAVSNGLEEVLSEILEFWDANFQTYFTAVQVIKNIYTFGLLSEVSSQLNTYREENDLLLISDFPIFLNNIIGDSDTPYIYEKIGSKYSNYLIDEFQDTSGLQWQNFKPLVRDSVDAGKFSMVVGDIKQSIYRWRGGDWKLLLDKIKEDIGEDYSRDIPLSFNWRSKRNIIDFNNRLFNTTPNILYEHFLKEAGPEITEIKNIKKAYAEVEQGFVESEKSEGGLIDVKFIEKSIEKPSSETAISYLISTLEELQDSNFNLQDIAILITNKNEGNLITDALLERQRLATNANYKYDIISNESLYLKNSHSVNFVIRALKVLSDPTEEINRYELVYAWFVYLKGEEPTDIQQLVNDKDDPIIIMEQYGNHLRSLNLIDQVEMIVRLFNLKDYTSQLAYLLAFQDAVLDFSSKVNKGLDGFLEWWEENKARAIQVSDDMEAIRLMTIHKSKGLQFKVVIIPFANWRLDHTPIHDNIVWCDTLDKEPFRMLPFVPLKYKKDMNKTVFASDYWEEKVKVYVDHLNLLYVAFTRAEEALYIISEKDTGKRNELSYVNQLLLKYFDSLEIPDEWTLEENHYQIGELTPYSVYEQDKVSEELKLTHFISNPWYEREGLAIRSGQFIRNEEVVNRINEGVILHFILSKVIVRKDFKKAIKLAEVEFGLSYEEVNAVRKKLRAIFDIEGVNSWFSDEWEIKNEMSIITESGNIKRPDRVMIKENQAILVDFKTGQQSESHKNQVSRYMEILRSMGFRTVSGYLLYIEDCKLQAV